MNTIWDDLRLLFRRLFRRGRAGVETLGVSLERQAALQRVAANFRALARERDDLLKTIGRKVYTLHVRGKVRNRDVLADCRRIDELREEMRALQVQMDAIRLRGSGEPGDATLTDDSQLGDDEEPEMGAAEEKADPAPEPEKALETAAETESEAESEEEAG
jgi:hypothetical protein